MKLPPLIPILALALLASCASAPPAASIPRQQQLADEGAAAMFAKDYAKAQALTAEAIGIDPQFAEAWAGYGMASASLGQADHARQGYERALALYQARHLKNPSDANPVLQQVFLLTVLGRPAEAEALLKQARADYPKDEQLGKMTGDFTAMKEAWKSWTVEAK
jgi:tetratricopeptide (TPR) repeat protein